MRFGRHLRTGRRLIVAALVGAGLAPAPVLAETTAFPTRSVTMVVPFAAGGPSDAVARLLAQKMSEALGQQVVIENVAGAGGMTGTVRAARAAPDGYTILINDLALPAGTLLNRNVTFSLSDVETVGLVNGGPMVVIGRPGFPADSAKELFAALRAAPDKVTLGHSGQGSNSYMCGLLLQQALGIKLTDVAYRGAGPAMNDLIGGRIDLECEQSTTAIPQIESRTVTSYAVTSPGRLANLPDLPTLAEAGLAGFEFVVWHGLYAPRGTPAAMIARLNEALRTALANPDARRRYAEFGRTEFPDDQLSPAAHRAKLDTEVQKLRAALEAAGVAIEK